MYPAIVTGQDVENKAIIRQDTAIPGLNVNNEVTKKLEILYIHCGGKVSLSLKIVFTSRSEPSIYLTDLCRQATCLLSLYEHRYSVSR
jgi:hypothetical protein